MMAVLLPFALTAIVAFDSLSRMQRHPRQRYCTILFSFVTLLVNYSTIDSYCQHYFLPHFSPVRPHFSRPANMIHLFLKRPGATNDYLSNLTTNNNEENSSKGQENQDNSFNRDSDRGKKESSIENPISKVQSAFSNVASSVLSSELGKRTTEMASGLINVTGKEKEPDIQSLASSNTLLSSVERVTKKGMWDVRRTKWRATNAAKKSALDFVATGRGLTDIHFFEVVRFTPKIKAEDVVKWIDSQARSGTDIFSSKAKTLVLNFTGKREYQFGDVTKELVRRVASGGVNMQDTLLLLKILIAIGATVGPIAELMPFTLLIEVLNISLEQKVGGKVVEVLSQTLDKRLVAALFTSDDKNLIGDVVKRTLLGGVLQFTGKANYESGDIQRAVQANNCTDEMYLTLDIDAEFEEWDKKFVEKLETEDYLGSQAKIMDMKIAIALEECDAILLRKNAEN